MPQAEGGETGAFHLLAPAVESAKGMPKKTWLSVPSSMKPRMRPEEVKAEGTPWQRVPACLETMAVVVRMAQAARSKRALRTVMVGKEDGRDRTITSYSGLKR